MLPSINFIMTITKLLALLAFSALGDDALDDNSDKGLSKCLAVPQAAVMANNLAKPITDKYFQLLGKAKFSVLFWDIYESQLLTTDGRQPFSNLCQHSLFEIHYLRDISQKELVENTIAQWRHLALHENEYSAFIPLLENIWPDIKAGDQLAMLNQTGRTVFYLNQQKIGQIENLAFAKAFLRIWLDEKTSEPELRQQLLGNSI